MAQFCASCGAPLTPMNQFCPRCGKPVMAGGMGMGGQANPQNLISALGVNAENKAPVQPGQQPYPNQPQMGYGGYPPQGQSMPQQAVGYQQPGMYQQPGAFGGMGAPMGGGMPGQIPGQGMVQGAMNAVGQMLGGAQGMGQALSGMPGQGMMQGAMNGIQNAMGGIQGAVQGVTRGLGMGGMGQMPGQMNPGMGQMAGTAATALGAAALGAAAMGMFNGGGQGGGFFGGMGGGSPMGGGMPQQGGLSEEQKKDPFAALAEKKDEPKDAPQQQDTQAQPQTAQPAAQQAQVQTSPPQAQTVQQSQPAQPVIPPQPETPPQVAVQTEAVAQPVIPPQPEIPPAQPMPPQPDLSAQPEVSQPAPQTAVQPETPPQVAVQTEAAAQPVIPPQPEILPAQPMPPQSDLSAQSEVSQPVPQTAAQQETPPQVAVQPEAVSQPVQSFTLPAADAPQEEAEVSKSKQDDDFDDDPRNNKHDDDNTTGGSSVPTGSGFKTSGSGQGMSLVSPIVAAGAVAAGTATTVMPQSQTVQPQATFVAPVQNQAVPQVFQQPQTGMGTVAGVGAAVSAASSLMRIAASKMPGETELGTFQPLAAVTQSMAGVANILNPLRTLTSIVRRIVTCIPNMFKNPKALIMTLCMAAVWIAQIFMQQKGINILPTRILSYLTFARGGMNRSMIGLLGGILGQGTVAAAIFSMFNGGWKKSVTGFRSLLSGNTMRGGLAPALIGTGASMLLYDIFTGFPAANRSMAGIAGLLIALQSLGSRGGNLRMLATSITSIPNRMTGARIAQPEQATSLLSGTSIGFAVSSLMALLPFNFRVSYIGIVALIAGLVLKYVIANRQPNMAMAGNYGMQQPFTQPGVPQGAVQCPKCGKQIAPNAKFCPGCGNKMM